MFKRKRRRQRLQWMPPLGTEPTGDVQYPDWPAYQHDCSLVLAGRDESVVVQALTWDYPPEESIVLNSGIPSLADWEQSAWRLRRLVGKLFVGRSDGGAQGGSGNAFATEVTAGFIVLRVNDDDGTPLSAANVISYSPGNVGGNRDPWLWRRTWLLGAGTVTGLAGTLFTQNKGIDGLPAHNALYGSIQDGPHIDAKTNRVIGPEERLFMVLSARNICSASAQDNSSIYWFLDYRLLGSVMKATNRRNASR